MLLVAGAAAQGNSRGKGRFAARKESNRRRSKAPEAGLSACIRGSLSGTQLSRSESERVRTQSAEHPIRTVVPHRQPTAKGQVSAPQGGSPQVTDPAHY
ncbi:hypothetical protein GCM10010363_12300 [Streptomyces omiyaensis]|nr:hypothetical protein GCM10010363_12300 [Streptomyces omiyaensis]